MAVVRWVEIMAIVAADDKAVVVCPTRPQAAIKMIDSLSFVDFVAVVYFSSEAKVLSIQTKCACCVSILLGCCCEMVPQTSLNVE